MNAEQQHEIEQNRDYWDEFTDGAQKMLEEEFGKHKPEYEDNEKQNFFDFIGWTDNAERLEIRRGKCGAPSVRADKTTGNKLTGTYRCNNLRGEFACTKCRSREGHHVMCQMVDVGREHGGIYMVKLNKDNATNLVREIGDKATYRRFSVAINEDVIVIGQKDLAKFEGLENVEYVRFDNMGSVDWTTLACGVQGRNKSGSLGIKKVVGPEEKGEHVEVMEVVLKMNTTEEEQFIAWNEATKRTANLDPKTAKDLSKAIRIRTKLFIEILGSKVDFVVVRNERVIVKNINWRLPQVN